MPPQPSSEQRAFEKTLARAARSFDLKPLLNLLLANGFTRDTIILQSSLGGTSASIIEEVSFKKHHPRLAYVTLNVGLLGDSSLLPSYFLQVIEQSPDADKFYDFIRFFDNRLLWSLIDALYPEDNARIFRDWSSAKQSFLKLLGVGSVSTLRWLFQLYFPELRVQVQRSSVLAPNTTDAFSFKPSSQLDGASVLGGRQASDASGFTVELIADEETNGRGKGWAGIVKARLETALLPRLAPFKLPLLIRVRVLEHASWARLEDTSQHQGFLGYDRILGDEATGHTFVVFRGVTGETQTIGA